MATVLVFNGVQSIKKERKNIKEQYELSYQWIL